MMCPSQVKNNPIGAAMAIQISPSQANVKRPAQKTPRVKRETYSIPFLSVGYFLPYIIVDVRPITVGSQTKRPVAYPIRMFVAKKANVQLITLVIAIANIFRFVLSLIRRLNYFEVPIRWQLTSRACCRGAHR